MLKTSWMQYPEETVWSVEDSEENSLILIGDVSLLDLFDSLTLNHCSNTTQLGLEGKRGQEGMQLKLSSN